ncbi:MAG: CCA tRNA nucleotidyltransferase [Actinomycetota bacterium]
MTVPPGATGLAALIGPVAERFAAAGYRLYLVGGVVRDLALAGDAPFDPGANDIDLTTDAEPSAIKRLIAPMAEAVWSQGERFGTIGAQVDGQAMEITTHRAEAYDEASRKPMVRFGTDLGEDLSRRDFTINAVAVEVPGLVLHDPYDGLVDLVARRLRTPLSPEVSFTDDPLRMLRAARFLTRFDLTPDRELVDAAVGLADRLDIVSAERITDELERLLAVADPGPGIRFLVDTSLLGRILPAYRDDPAGIGLAAALAAVSTARDEDRVLVRRAGLLWPIRQDAGDELRRLRHSRAAINSTVWLLDAAADAVALGDRTGDEARSGVVRRIADRIGTDRLDALASLVWALATEAPDVDAAAPAMLAATVDRLRSGEDLADLGAPLTGAEIIAELGIEPGPEIGRLVRLLRDHRLDHGPIDRGEALRLLRSWRER